MGYFKDLKRIKELKEKKGEMELFFKDGTLEYLLKPNSGVLDSIYGTTYSATDMIYAELTKPNVINIIRRYVYYIEPPTPDMSRRVRQANTSYLDLHIRIVSETVFKDENILHAFTQQVLNDTYNFGETYAYVQFMPGYMESHLKSLKQYKIYCTVMFPKEARTLKKQIANLEAVLKQEPVISKIPHSSY